MTSNLDALKQLLNACSDQERRAVFLELRKTQQIHALEDAFGAPAELILEAIHRAPELTRRMLRGVIADAAFALMVVPELANLGWENDTPEGNHAFDHRVRDATGTVTVQVKLQRSEKQEPFVSNGRKYGLLPDMYMVEVQRTRTGKKPAGDPGAEAKATRPYEYGSFDLLAVSLWPSTGHWGDFMYTLERWLVPGPIRGNIATYQPVPRQPNADWTDDFATAVQWLRHAQNKTICGIAPTPQRKAVRKTK